MGLKNLSSINEALDLQYKAIMTLYKYTDDLKKTTNEILGNMNDIVGDTEINKMDIFDLQKRVDTINKVQLLQNENTNLLLVRMNDISKHDGYIKMMMAEIENINIKMRNDRIHFLCYLIIIIICPIIPLFYHL